MVRVVGISDGRLQRNLVALRWGMRGGLVVLILSRMRLRRRRRRRRMMLGGLVSFEGKEIEGAGLDIRGGGMWWPLNFMSGM